MRLINQIFLSTGRFLRQLNKAASDKVRGEMWIISKERFVGTSLRVHCQYHQRNQMLVISQAEVNVHDNFSDLDRFRKVDNFMINADLATQGI